jgi:hypothetical protein
MLHHEPLSIIGFRNLPYLIAGSGTLTQTFNLQGCTLDGLIEALLAGYSVLPVAATEPFPALASDGRKLLAAYVSHREWWDTKAQVRPSEIDELLMALDRSDPALAKTSFTISKAGKAQIWSLKKVEAYRFAGLCRHCGQTSPDPVPFIADLDGDITLITGFNGAGKTSLLSAISWCLTGRALRSQQMPGDVHEPMTLEYSSSLGKSQEPDGPSYRLPPIVPVPTGPELERIDDKPRVDTWVRLTVSDTDTGELRQVCRRLVASPRGRVDMVVDGLTELGLSRLALEVGTLMPAIASQMRFDERTGFRDAVAQLTGFRPLEELGIRTKRVIGRLEGEEAKKASADLSRLINTFSSQRQNFEDFWNSQADIGTAPQLLSPDTHDRERTCASDISAAGKRINELSASLADGTEEILGIRLAPPDSEKLQRHLRTLAEAAERLSQSGLNELPKIQILRAIGRISENDAEQIGTLINDISTRAWELDRHLENKIQAARWSLYARVAEWHRDQHPEAAISECPVCGTDLSNVPDDAALSISVREALDICRNAEKHISKSASQRERDESAAFISALPQTLQGFADDAPLPGLLDLLRTAYLDELFDTPCFTTWLAPLKSNASVIWSQVITADHLTPPAEPSIALPARFHDGDLARRIRAVRCAILLASQRKSAAAMVRQGLERLIGTESSLEHGPSLRTAPLRVQLDLLRRSLTSQRPIVVLSRSLNELDNLRQAWDQAWARQGALRRAAGALQTFVHFPELVGHQSAGLIKELDDDLKCWKDHFYKSHYISPLNYGSINLQEERGIGLKAAVGRLHMPAHAVMNASFLRACVWAFIISLWQRVRAHSSSLTCFLLDDPQIFLDEPNKAKFAYSLLEMIKVGARPVLVSCDLRFTSLVKEALAQQKHVVWSPLCLSPTSSARETARLSPDYDEVRRAHDIWREDENNDALARSFVEKVRVYLETRLWDVLAADPDAALPCEPSLADLLNHLQGSSKRGVQPFSDDPFRKLLRHRTLRNDAPFYTLINKAHHRPHEISPTDAVEVAIFFKELDLLLRACLAAYSRFMLRLTPEERDLLTTGNVPLPPAFDLHGQRIPMLGTLAARSSRDILSETESESEVDLSQLGSVAFFVIRSDSLAPLARRGDTLVVSLDDQPVIGEPVVALHNQSAYVRRLGCDMRDPSRVLLYPDRTIPGRHPPDLVLPASHSSILPVIGVIYGSMTLEGSSEAVLLEHSPFSGRTFYAARVADESAYPSIRSGDIVLLDSRLDDYGKVGALQGSLVAVVAEGEAGYFGYLKRLDREIAPGLHLLISVGLGGSPVCVSSPAARHEGHPELRGIWRVRGHLRRNRLA